MWTFPARRGTAARMTDHVHFIPGPDTSSQLRAAFGRFATGVTIVTAHTDFGPIGMTANSFSSVSLDPPLVMWAPGCASRRHDAFVAAQRFCIHILGSDQLDIATHFATRGDGFDAFDTTIADDGLPLLTDCAARFICTHFAAHPAGDHTVVLGQVTQASFADRPGLIFASGQYGNLNPTA